MKYLLYCLIVLFLTTCTTEKNTNKTENTYTNQKDSVDFTFEFDIEFENQRINNSDLIQDSIISTILGNEFVGLDKQQAIQKYANASLESFVESLDTLDYKTNLYNKIEGKILYSNNDYITFRRLTTVSTESNFDSKMTTCCNYVFDTKTGQHLKETDIFSTQELKKIRTLLQEKAKEMTQTNKIKYDLKRIKPNNNFAITDSTIIYTFNPYEIAPSKFGFIDITIERIHQN